MSPFWVPQKKTRPDWIKEQMEGRIADKLHIKNKRVRRKRRREKRSMVMQKNLDKTRRMVLK